MKSRQLPGESSYDKEPLESDYYEAKCFLVAGIGTQVSTYLGEEKKQLKVIFGFEFENEKNEDGTPRVIFHELTDSLDERSNMRQIFNTWLGSKEKPFTDERAKDCDLSQLAKLGIRGRLNITQKTSKKDRVYNKITGIVPSKLGGKSKPVKKITAFDFCNPVKEEFDKLPKYIQDKITTSPEWAKFSHLMGGGESQETVNITPEIQKEFGAEANPTPEQQKIINESSSVEDDDLPF